MAHILQHGGGKCCQSAHLLFIPSEHPSPFSHSHQKGISTHLLYISFYLTFAKDAFLLGERVAQGNLRKNKILFDRRRKTRNTVIKRFCTKEG
ncbi:hypothetical protein POVWA2_081800 [Plasmodium ovale wallikeri]|uniref:Uncharacterized protein n=1 Tax=Plasmodium ovale wallikeri TaxID=864142 RepID=A0A1A8ZNX0_PLAOA|nr:hypothetical protein POVWA1_052110 [Plasmodium ovale wallikeri]SBT57824.1 hypothetical protein POVWA2_081800 [Plasmodium ovale wallikeri]